MNVYLIQEEREVFGREIFSLRHQLLEFFDQRWFSGASNDESVEHLRQMWRGGEEDVFMSPTPLHSMVTDCSKILSHLKSILDDQLLMKDTVKRLNASLYTKEQETEDLYLRLAQSNVCQDVVISYFGSVREIWSKSLKESSDEIINKLLPSLETVIGREGPSPEDSVDGGFSLVERKVSTLIEKHIQLLSEAQQFKQFIVEIMPELLISEDNDFSFVYSVARQGLVESQQKEAFALEKISAFEDENRRLVEEINMMKESLKIANAEANKTKVELEQTENKLATAREKLSIAVTKGKSLVQHRDSLKHSLAEKISELEQSTLELQQKVNALEASEASIDNLKQLLAEKTAELEDCLFQLQQKSNALETAETIFLETNQSLAEKTSELEKCLQELHQKVNALEASESSIDNLKQLLAEKTTELENCFLQLQQKSTALETADSISLEMNQVLAEKTRELEKCLLELQQKANALEASEASNDHLKQLLAEKTSELEDCVIQLQKKSSALEIAETSSLEMNRSSAEKSSELEKCLLELQQKSEALESVEAISVDLKQSLAERNDELDRCVLELAQKSDALVNTENSCEELNQLLAVKNSELEKLLLELQQKPKALDAIEVHAEELKQSLARKTDELEKCLQKLQQTQTSESTVEELKMLLAEKVNELDRCQLELQQKSDSLQTVSVITKELEDAQILVNSLQDSLTQKNKVLQEIEEIVQNADSKEDFLAMEVVDKIKWFVNHKHKLDAIMLESKKFKDAFSSIDMPETISSAELGPQIQWLVKSFAQAKEDIVKLQDDINGAMTSVGSHESDLSEAHREIERLSATIFELNQGKDEIQAAHNDLKSKYEKIVEKLASIFPENDGLTKELAPQFAMLNDQQSLDAETLIENYVTVIGERMKTSLTQRQKFEQMQTLLYIKCLEHMIYENILEEEIINRSDTVSISNELRRASEEIITLRNEKEALRKELERVEEKSSLIREKLSLAVKKGKGLVQEREGFKQSLDQKNTEIGKLKLELQRQESAIAEYKQQIESLSAYPEHIQKLESDLASLKDLKEQSETNLLESNKMMQMLVQCIEDISLPTDKTFERPVEKLYWISDYLHEAEVAKTQIEQELDEIKSEAILQTSRLADAVENINTLRKELSMAEEHIFSVTQEKEDALFGKVNIEQQLEKLKEASSMQANKLENAYASIRSLEDQLARTNIELELEELKEESSVQASKLEKAYATIKSLEEALTQASNSISNLEAEKRELESKSQQQLDALTVKLAACMEELKGTHRNSENQSRELISHFGDLRLLIEDEGLFSLMTENFREKVEGLRHVGNLIHDLNDLFIAKGLHLHSGLEVIVFPLKVVMRIFFSSLF